ncbi:S8 family peptidase [Chryseobacterium sp. PMSZPI]|uniref:S8 family peptidase n=1 Tax=Chryseobacterium sp. PMSZPI TaxID=1033900 RepID=UPI000C32F23B|nr:S8 family peptidase [Chryseobacterium sp. PMSZPI]PKF74530.1 hypothetical protein CW752_08855 [Chryseobacterium sp. PMSZPI]
MNFKKLFSTKVHITDVVKKHLTGVLSIFLTLWVSLYFGQEKRLDYRFKALLKNKENLAKGIKNEGVEDIQKELTSHLVVTAKGAKTMYSCIIYTKTPERLKADGVLVQSVLPGFATALVDIEDIEKILALPYVTAVMAPRIDRVNNDVSRIQSGASLLQDGILNNMSYNGSGVLVGVYDTGIDWKHPDFRGATDQTKSRIYSIWDQTLTAQGTEAPPTGFNVGVEYTRAQIEDEIDGTPTGIVREQDSNGHGTHVAGTAAGNGAGFSDKRHKGFATNADLVIVKGGNGSFSTTNTINAITYFKNIATALNRPIVVNMSLGGHLNGHDGTTADEVAVNNFTASGPGRVVVIAAGNEYGDKLHRSINIEPGATQSYTFTVASNTTNGSVLGFMMYTNNTTPVTTRLTTPDGQQYTQNFGGFTTNSISSGGFQAILENNIDNDNNRSYAFLFIKRATGSTANCQGAYKLEVTNPGTAPIVTHGWLYMGKDSNNNTLAQLDNGNSDYAVGSPGNASTAITVASYNGRANFLSSADDGLYGINGVTVEGISNFSNKGPRVDGILKPEITASGQFVISAMSSNSPEGQISQSITRISDKYVINTGTSMACPGVAGSVALLLQANPNLTAATVKTRLTNAATQDAQTGAVPNPRWGYGKLNIYKAVASEIGCAVSEFESVTYDTQFYQDPFAGNYYWDNIVFAVKYTPTRTGKLSGVNFFTANPAMGNVPFTIDIKKVDASGNPGELIASKSFTSIKNTFYRVGWNYINLSDLNVNITTKEDFYVVLNTSGGRMALFAEQGSSSGRSKYSNNNGTTWTSLNGNLRIRAVVYEDKPEIKKLATVNLSKTLPIAAGKNYFINNCEFIARVEKEAASTITGNVTSKVWVDAAQSNYVSRRYEINPVENASTATGKITLYFKQEDFDAYNLTSTIKLPTSSTDNANKANLVVEKYTGTSAGSTGTIASFGSPAVVIPVNVADIVWNETYKYWEVSFQTTGLGGYFVKTNSTLGTKDLTLNSDVNITPNPAKDMVQVMLGKYSKASVTIYDASGKLVKTANVDKASNKIELSGLVKGAYLFTIKLNDDTQITKKVIKE